MTALPFGHPDSELPHGDGVAQAAQRLAPFIAPSPCYPAFTLSARIGFEVWLKVEALNPIGCFKLRGALNSLLVQRERGTVSGAVTSSTGNHGQGVAYAAKLLGLPAHVFVPEHSNPTKLERIQRLGATLHVGGSDIDDAKARARQFAAERGLGFVDDGEDLEMMNGAGTVGLELAQQARDLDCLFVPMGSGTLVAGVAAAVKSRSPKVELISVQPTGAPAMTHSFEQRRPIEHAIDTIADGLVCRVPAERALDAILRWVDRALLVSDDLILSAMHTLIETEHVLVEPSGAAALAGSWLERSRLASKRVGVVLTGSNLAPDVLSRALSAPLLGRRGSGAA